MAFVRPSGEAAEAPMAGRSRGRTLADDEVRRLRDLVLVILVRIVGLSIPDALAILHARVNRQQTYKRLSLCPLSGKDAIKALLAGGRLHRAG